MKTTLQIILIKILKYFKYYCYKIINFIIPQQVLFDFRANSFRNKYKRDKLTVRENVNLLFSASDKERIINSLNEISPNIIHDTIKSADLVCTHIINIFEKEYSFGKDINWHKDLISGYEWPLDYFADLKIINLSDFSDVKFPWELNRFYHAVELGKAYWYSSDEGYTDEFISEIESWILKNPYNKGINWNCSMEVGIRAVNLIWSYCFFIESKRLSDEFHGSFLNLIYSHGKHIYRNLENKSLIKGNHYIANLIGLLYISFVFPIYKSSKKWNKFAIKEIKKCMEEQVNIDGANFEASIPYHRLVSEMFLHAALLIGVFNGKPSRQSIMNKNIKNISEDIIGKQYLHRLEKMCEFIFHYTRPDGLAPQMGDNDNGRLVKLGIKDAINDHRHILAIAGEFFNRDDFRFAGRNSYEEAIWLFRGHITYPDNKEVPVDSKKYPESGIYIMRKDRDYLVVRCCQPGTGGKGTHTHNDNLGFELCVDRIPYIIDPGTYTYSRDVQIRNLFRSTSYHNTVLIDGNEQNELSKTDLFLMNKKCETRVLGWTSTQDEDIFSGECSYNIKGSECITHRRDILFDKRKRIWKINDAISGEGIHDLNWYFHSNKGISIILQNDHVLFISDYGKVLNLTLDFNYFQNLLNGYYSPSYDAKESAPILQLSSRVGLPFECNFEFRVN